MSKDTLIRTIVIGGTGHVGEAICRHLKLAGHIVAFTYFNNRAKAMALADELQISCHDLDLAVHDSIAPTLQHIADKLGGLDSIVIAAGLATAHQKEGLTVVPGWDEIEPASFARMLSINVMGTFFACQWAGTAMKKRKAGRIVLIGSIDGVKPVPSPTDYACCKAALAGMVQSLSKDLGPHGILINLIAPGILNGGIAGLLRDDLRAEYLKHCTLKRVGTPDEIANWSLFLAGPKNSYLTGQTVILDGGL
ncbi:MAG: SDR family oxidoreductase [bacterium]